MHILSSFCVLMILVIQTLVQCQENKRYEYSVNGKPKLDNAHDDVITIPEDVVETKDNTTMNEIPMEIIEKLNDMSDMQQFIDQYVDKSTIPRGLFGMQTRSAAMENVERAAAIKPISGRCMPQLEVVSLRPTGSHDSSLLYIPECIRMNRCGGCCNMERLQCLPTEIENKNVEVTILRHIGNSKFQFVIKTIEIIDEHISCKCQCKITAKNCTLLQVYDAANCKCKCNNTEDRIKCENHTEKRWNGNNCICECKVEQGCTTGTLWDHNECKCSEMKSQSYRFWDGIKGFFSRFNGNH